MRKLSEQEMEYALNTLHVMIDIETLDTAPNAVVMSIGVAMGTLKDGILYEQYKELDVENQLRKYRTKSESTVQWWRDQIAKGTQWPGLGTTFPGDALDSLFDYIGAAILPCNGNYLIWSKGPQFDIALIESLYKSYVIDSSTPIPWKYNKIMDFRTTLQLFPEFKSVKPVGHHALQDARDQFEVLRNILRYHYNVPEAA